MNEMNICNNETIEEAVEVAEVVTKNTGAKNAALIGAGAIGAIVVTKLIDLGWKAIKKYKAKRNEKKSEEPCDDELEDLPPIDDDPVK